MLTVRQQALDTKANVKSVNRRQLGNAVTLMIATKLCSFAQQKEENGDSLTIFARNQAQLDDYIKHSVNVSIIFHQ
jgi:hypothetical protein